MSEHFSFPSLAVSYEKKVEEQRVHTVVSLHHIFRLFGKTDTLVLCATWTVLYSPYDHIHMVWKQKARHMQNLTGQVWALRNLACIICHYWERVGVSFILPICAAGVSSSLPGHFHW